MGVIQLPDELQQVIEREVAEGRAISPAAFLHEAVMRLVDGSRAEEEDIRSATEVGLADIAAGRYMTIASQEDGERLLKQLMARVRDGLASERVNSGRMVACNGGLRSYPGNQSFTFSIAADSSKKDSKKRLLILMGTLPKSALVS